MIKPLFTATSLLTLSALSQSAELEITLTNATQGIHFTPVLLAAHPEKDQVFSLGSAASDELKAIAEGGDISGATTSLLNSSANVSDGNDENAPGASNGPVAPGDSFTVTLMTDEENGYLSLASMLLPTNDGFVGLNSWKIPSEAGTYTLYLTAYDAGTEKNDELASSIPNAPFVTTFGTVTIDEVETVNTSGGTGVTASGTEDSVVLIHRGNLGDTNPEGGISDIDATKHRWLNPIARLDITVK